MLNATQYALENLMDLQKWNYIQIQYPLARSQCPIFVAFLKPNFGWLGE